MLDNRNGHFEILEYFGMRKHSTVKCKECGSVFEVSIDSLLRNKTKESFGCVNCNRLSMNENHKKLLSNNNLTLITDNNDGTYCVKCNICNNLYTRLSVNLLSPKFLCPDCDDMIRNNKIIQNQHLYKENTYSIAKTHSNLQLLYNNQSFKWFYFIGLMMADGSFNSYKHRMRLFLNQKDKNVIYEIAKILECPVIKQKNNCFGIDMTGQIVLTIIEKYNISNQKTYHPCDISSIKGENLLAFIIGFIDGDGNVAYRSDTKSPKITIKLHKSWKDNLEYISKNLYNYYNIPNYPKPIYVKINNENKYSQLTIGNQKVIKGLYNFMNNNSLSVMDRKWDKIKEVM